MSQFDELPDGWEICTLEEISKLATGKTPSTSKSEFWDGDIPFITPSQIHPSGYIITPERGVTNEGAKQARIIPSESILIVCIGSVGKIGYLDRNAVINQQLNALIPENHVLSKYLYYWSKYYLQNWVIQNAVATVNAAILNKSRLGKAPAIVPPLNEQRRILEKIEALTARSRKARAALDEIPALLDQFRQSVLAAAFRGDLTADWRAQNPNVEPAEALLERIRVEREGKATSTRDKSRLHKDWEELEAPSRSKSLDTWLKCSIGHIGNVCNGSTPSRKEDDYWGGSISWVSSGEVQNNIIFSTREKITEAGFKNSSGRILPVETVLIAMIGEGKTRGQTAILKIQATINQNIAAVVLDHGLLSSQYLWHWFRYKYSETRRAGSGSGPQALNCQRVRVSVPGTLKKI